MKISIFNATQANQARNAKEVLDIPFSKLGEVICNSSWSPTIFKEAPYVDPKKGEKGAFYRNNKNVESMNGIGLDFDEGCSIEKVKKILKKQNLAAVIGTTRHHQKIKVTDTGEKKAACDRFRVVMKFDKPLKSDAELKELWPKISRIFPKLDEACKDAARFYFPCREVVAITKGSNFSTQLDPAFDSIEEVKTKPPFSKRGEKLNGVTKPNQKGRMARATNAFILFGAEDGKWHAAFFKAGMDLKEQGYSFEETRELLRKASTNSKHELDENDLYQLRDIFDNREPRYKPRIDDFDRELKEITDWGPVKDCTQRFKKG